MTETQASDPAAGETWSVRAGRFLCGVLTWPAAWLPAALGLALGAWGGRLAFLLWGSRRRIAVSNIEMIKANGFLPADLDARSVARESFANLGRTGWEVVRYGHRGLEVFRPDWTVEAGGEHLLAAAAESRKSGRGLLLVTGHMGNWELGSQFTADYGGFVINIVGRNTGRPLVDSLIRFIRTRHGNRYIPKDGGALKMMRVLKEGGVLGTLIDQAALGDHEGVTVSFMGRPASTNLGPLRLARRAGTAIVATFFRREGRRLLMSFSPPLAFREDLEEMEALADMAERLNDLLGREIRRCPDQWMWGHRRWKTKEGVRRDPESIT